MNFPSFYGTGRFITAITRARHRPLSWARSIQPMPPSSPFLKIRCNIILPSTSTSSKWSLSLRPPHQNTACTSPAFRDYLWTLLCKAICHSCRQQCFTVQYITFARTSLGTIYRQELALYKSLGIFDAVVATECRSRKGEIPFCFIECQPWCTAQLST